MVGASDFRVNLLASSIKRLLNILVSNEQTTMSSCRIFVDGTYHPSSEALFPNTYSVALYCHYIITSAFEFIYFIIRFCFNPLCLPLFKQCGSKYTPVYGGLVKWMRYIKICQKRNARLNNAIQHFCPLDFKLMQEIENFRCVLWCLYRMSCGISHKKTFLITRFIMFHAWYM